jgi:GTPase SAR1 family protein
MNTMDFISYKKLLIFGAKKVGKTSLAKTFETTVFDEDVEEEESQKNSNLINNFYLNG